MNDLLLPRRALLKAAASLIAFPAIVKAESLMKVKAIDEYGRVLLGETIRNGNVLLHTEEYMSKPIVVWQSLLMDALPDRGAIHLPENWREIIRVANIVTD